MPPTSLGDEENDLESGRRTPSTIVQVSHHQPADEIAEQGLFAGEVSVEELLGYAVANNPEIGAARFRAQAALERVPQARSLDDPQVTANSYLNDVETAAGSQDLVLAIAQKFPWFGKRSLRGDVAFQHAQAAFSELAAVELATVEKVKLAYFETYFLDSAIEVNRSLEPRLKDVIEIVRAKYKTDAQKTGLESVNQVEVELFRLQARIIELQQARLRALAKLAAALHLPPGMPLEVKPQLTRADLPVNVDLLVGLIERCQPELDARRREINRDRSSIDLAGRQYYPDLTLGLNYHAIANAGLSPVANGNDAYSLVLGVNLPVYRRRLDAGVREAQWNLSRSVQHYEATYDQVQADVKTLHAVAVEHDRVLQIIERDILRRSKQTLDLAIESYRQDRIDFQRLIESYKDLLGVEIEHYQRQSLREQALAQLERRVGCAISTWPLDTVNNEDLEELSPPR